MSSGDMQCETNTLEKGKNHNIDNTIKVGKRMKLSNFATYNNWIVVVLSDVWNKSPYAFRPIYLWSSSGSSYVSIITLKDSFQ